MKKYQIDVDDKFQIVRVTAFGVLHQKVRFLKWWIQVYLKGI
jgi:hypothetical protein